MSQPLSVCVVIPFFNRERLIVDALRSVALQTVPPTALVVVDDGSTDGGVERVRAFFESAALPFRGDLIRQPNAGVASARIAGIRGAPPCDLIAMLDSDDLWPTDYLEGMTRALAAHPDAVAASRDRKVVDVETEFEETRSSAHLQGRATQAIWTHGVAPPSATVIRGDAYRTVGGYDPALRYRDDGDLFLRLSLRGPWVYVPGEPVTMRRNTAGKFNGPPHLTGRSIPGMVEMAEVHERFVLEHGGRSALPEAVWRPKLADLWRRLARELMSRRRGAEAAWCFDRAAEYRPPSRRDRWRRLRSRLRGRPAAPVSKD